MSVITRVYGGSARLRDHTCTATHDGGDRLRRAVQLLTPPQGLATLLVAHGIVNDEESNHCLLAAYTPGDVKSRRYQLKATVRAVRDVWP